MLLQGKPLNHVQKTMIKSLLLFREERNCQEGNSKCLYGIIYMFPQFSSTCIVSSRILRENSRRKDKCFFKKSTLVEL